MTTTALELRPRACDERDSVAGRPLGQDDRCERGRGASRHWLGRKSNTRQWSRFNEAMHRCQEKMKRISADMENHQTHSRYASYAPD